MKMISLQGCSRIVFFFGDYAIKIPNFTVCHSHWLQGCHGNWSERILYKSSTRYGIELKHLLAPSYFCSWFGLFQIQAKCQPKLEHLTEEEKTMFKGITSDIKKENFGYFKNNLVCFDYA
jgi:hypothetical protein